MTGVKGLETAQMPSFRASAWTKYVQSSGICLALELDPGP